MFSRRYPAAWLRMSSQYSVQNYLLWRFPVHGQQLIHQLCMLLIAIVINRKSIQNSISWQLIVCKPAISFEDMRIVWCLHGIISKATPRAVYMRPWKSLKNTERGAPNRRTSATVHSSLTFQVSCRDALQKFLKLPDGPLPRLIYRLLLCVQPFHLLIVKIIVKMRNAQ